MELRHPLWLRLLHWWNMVSILLLCLTGYSIHSPQTIHLFGSMSNARMIHFVMGYVLLIGLVMRIYFAMVTKDYKNIVYQPIKDTMKLPSMLKYYLFLAKSHPFYGKYNPGQKAMYTGWVFMALIQIITGFILYMPNTFMALGGLLGGLMTVRLIHYIVTWLFVLTILAHVYLDMSEGVPVLMSMVTGEMPADFDHGTHEGIDGHAVDMGGKGISA
jgi:Ni/Fe-hydrogenase 1 B-type cytochrome subunit